MRSVSSKCLPSRSNVFGFFQQQPSTSSLSCIHHSDSSLQGHRTSRLDVQTSLVYVVKKLAMFVQHSLITASSRSEKLLRRDSLSTHCGCCRL
ncbi:uncharacterized protein LY89DRAFT_242923 [Mollisia scopiformis]|uniref:Uncharacterized protein n=1 Tax=Mollisia scopiformis TaxID=149040 RepID=A0A194WTS1_MOLSC|nr:uncharacterized protein LY89DRAFT_242923 [Mollisia scopiformis]KUJ11350.1 hypothetical protein LY89DRAFT_242923 [Mollisia scopiformis]